MKNLWMSLFAGFVLISAISLDGNAKTHKVAIAAHRGYWKNETAQNAQNSISSLRLAQENAFWGSECDIRLTKDDIVVVNHDEDINGKKIRNFNYSEIKDEKLSNGESICTFDQYLEQTMKTSKTVLVIELKPMKSDAADQILIEKTIQALKDKKLYNPKKVIFISFSLYTSKQLAILAPKFTNQYLNGELSPKELHALGINGLDYEQKVIDNNPNWVEEAHALGMSVNVWTVDKPEKIKKYAELGVDCITTNVPLVARELLGNAELTKGRK